MSETRPLRPGDVVSGYRLNRQLGAGNRATVWLAELDGALIQSESERISLESPRRVALKVFAEEVRPECVSHELSALARVRSDHVVRLHDVSQLAGESTVAVLECLQFGSLDDLILGREVVRPGECVTLLSSLVRAVDDLHRAGVAHAHLRARSVRFDAAGRPVIIGLGHNVAARDSPDDGPFADDFRQLSSLFERVLSIVDDEGRESELVELRRWLADTNPQESGDLFVEGIEERLFAFAQPVPLDLTSLGEPGVAVIRRPDVTSMVVDRRDQDGGRVGRKPFAQHESWASRMAERVAGSIDGSPLDAVRKRLADFGREHRKPLIVGGGSAALLLVAVLALVPSSTSLPPAMVESGAAREQPDGVPSARDTGRVSEGSGSPDSEPADSHVDDRSSVEDAQATDSDGSETEDPILAVTELLKRRHECIGTGSRTCLATVDQVGSPLLAADMLLVDSVDVAELNESIDVSSHTVSLLDRSGNVMLVALAPPASPSRAQTKPASALAIKGEAGWRLREIYEN